MTDESKGVVLPDDPVALKARIAELETLLSNNDVEGLKKNKDEILFDLKKAKAVNKELQAVIDKSKIDQDNAKKEKLKTDGELQKLLDMEKAEKEKVISEARSLKRLRNLEKIARAKGFDLDYIDAIYSLVKFDETDQIEEADSFFEKMKSEKPKFFESPKETVPATDTKKTNIFQKGHIFTRQEINQISLEDFKIHQVEIKAQERAGLVK
jgi:hypothetical protein